MIDDYLSQNIETDSYDREMFSEIESSSSELTVLIERGSNLLPDFRSLVLDIFASFYKLNVIFVPEEAAKKASGFARKIIEHALSTDTYLKLREETALDGFKSATAAIALGEGLINWIKSEEGFSKNSLLKEWEIKKAEDNYVEKKEQYQTFEEIEKNGTIDSFKDDKFKNWKRVSKTRLRYHEGELKDLKEQQRERLEDREFQVQKHMKSSIEQAYSRVFEADRELETWGTSMGINIQKTVGEKIDLASKLVRNEKLKRLALMVGSLREEMLKTRRRVWSRRGSEVYNVSKGDDLGKIIPSELVTLRHRVLRKDFFKRFIEDNLLQYYLREAKGRGPLIVCLDGSSSMDGNKEIWAKAVCITLLEMAKRDKRRFEVIVYSSKGSGLRHFRSKSRERWGMPERELIELAEYFPGGGTDFEEPLESAKELLKESKFKKGDIVFITDGECDVSDEWLNGFLKEKDIIKFRIYSVLIDLTGKETPKTLNKFSNRVTTVSKLTSKRARDIFISLD